MRKRNFYILVLMLTALVAQAQSGIVSIYGFRQQITGGMQKRGDLDESGQFSKQTPKPVFKYSIYLASALKTRIYPVQLWINGKPFSVKAEVVTIAQLPEDAKRHNGKTKSAVYKAGGTIWKLTPIPLSTDKSGGGAKALVAQNDVVVLYKTGGKLRYGVLKKFTDLDPVALQ